MAKKKNRSPRRARSGAAENRSRPRRSGLLSTPSLIFIGLIVLIVVVAIGVGMLSEGVDCPAGQVWSDAHAHCH